MARRANSLFTDKELLTIEGRSIKHVGLIREYGTPNWKKKVSDKPISLMGLDIETNHLTSELKLLGVWNGQKYSYYTDDFLGAIFNILKHCDWNRKALAYWNKLDPFIIFKQFVKMLPPERQQRALKRYGKVGGKWNRKEKGWSISPLVELRVSNSPYYFGIKQVIRSSMQFYIRKIDEEYLNTIWAFDIASLYKSGLAKEMGSRKDLFPYYSKISKEAHLVDWKKFQRDKHYRNDIVLKSNEYDARAVYDLGLYIQEQYFEAFGYYPSTLISTGSIARSAIVATLMNKYYAKYMVDPKKKNPTDSEKELLKKAEKQIADDVTHIGLIKHIDKWSKQIGDEAIKDFSCLCYEAYSGGAIDAIEYGYSKSGWLSDIASAYIYVITTLLNLKDSKMTTGQGEPPRIENSYCLIRGFVEIPDGIDYHPLTVKHFANLDTNVRGVGKFRASYTMNERDYLISLGATFSDETWYNIETDGTLSPLAEVLLDMTDLRYKLIKEGNSAEFMVKKSSASAYGVSFEATDEYEENDQLDVERIGYRGGEFLNPLYATIITSEVRLLIAKAYNGIKANGGKPTLVMTDCVFWEGKASDIPSELVRDVKTLGFFEKPVAIKDIAYLGTGRYSYTDEERGRVTTKNRGLNVSAIHDPEGIDLTSYDWNEALRIAKKNNTKLIDVKVRSLVSVGMVLHNKKYSIDDLGLVSEEHREVNILTGLTKRMLKQRGEIDVSQLATGLIGTKPIKYGEYMFGDEFHDQTLPILRDEVMKQDFKSAKTKDLRNRSDAQMRYASKKENKDKILKTYRDKYAYLKELGYSRNEAKKWCRRSMERINNELLGVN